MRQTDNDYNRLILQAISRGHRITQRSLAGELGVALGLTNLLIKRLVAKGYVRVVGMGTRHIRYLMTTSGWEALGHATKTSLENTVRLYTETREQIRSSLDALSEDCERDSAGLKPVVFYGIGDVAEIAYVSLQSTDLALVGAVDDGRARPFFGMPIHRPSALTPHTLAGVSYLRVVVTSLQYADVISERLNSLHIPADRVFRIAP